MVEHPDSHTWWRHRRRHSYIAMTAAVLETAFLLLAWANGGELADVQPLLWPSYMLWASVVGAYIGTSILDDMRARELKQHPQSR